MKKLLLTALLVIMLTPLRANAFDWGTFFRWLFFGAEPQTVTIEELNTTLSDIEKQIPTLDAKVQKSFLAIVPLLTTQNDAKKISEEIATIKSSNATATDKESQLLKIMSNYTTTLKNNKVGVILIIKTLSDKDKETFKKELSTLIQAGEDYSKLYTNSTTITSKVSKSADEEQVKVTAKINTETTSLKNKLKTVNDFTSQVKTYALLAGVSL